jgi:drug/metabolite transporter (DMT)-like permease
MINQTMSFKHWLMLLLLSFLWGGSFFFIGVAVTQLPPLTIVLLRVGIAALVLWSILLISGYEIPRSATTWRAFFVMGLVSNALPFSLIVWGQTHIGVGLASIINATTPMFTILIAGFFLTDEHITPQKLIGITAGLAGVIFLIGPSSLLSLGDHTLGQLAIMGAAISYGCATVFGRRFNAMGISPFNTAVGQVTAATIILLPVVLLVEDPLQLTNPSSSVWFSVIGLAVFSTALGYIIFFHILSTAGATNVVLVTFLVPVTASFLGWFILGEELQLKYFIGMAFIAVGLLVIDGRLWARFCND